MAPTPGLLLVPSVGAGVGVGVGKGAAMDTLMPGASCLFRNLRITARLEPADLAHKTEILRWAAVLPSQPC